MKGMRTFARATTIGGMITMLPLLIYLFVAEWLWGWITDAIQPITDLYMNIPPHNEIVGDLCSIATIVLACFGIGMLVKTGAGRGLYRFFEDRLLRRAPGYLIVKETVGLFVGAARRPFSQVALVRVFDSDTLMTAFITDSHADGSHTVFVPTGPNPMSGMMYHLKADRVYVVDVPVEDAMRSIIGCGAGSKELIEARGGV
jgi:uncharacterized membrane protein